jgi:hypothetical protein
MIPVSLQVHLVTKYHLIHTGADLFEQTITLSLLLHVGARSLPIAALKTCFFTYKSYEYRMPGLWHMHTGDKLRWKQTQSFVPGRDATYGIHSPPR